MRRAVKRVLVAAAFLTLAVWGQKAEAISSATVNIEVTLVASLSVSVNGAASSTQTVTWNTANPNQAQVSAATATVTNNSGVMIEKWALSTDTNSVDQGTEGSWSLAASTTSVGVNKFAVQAVFGSSSTVSCPSASSTDWNASFAAPLTTTPQSYSDSLYADSSLNVNGTYKPDDAPNSGDMFPGDSRALCWRLIMPNGTTVTDTQNIQLVITAQGP
jgi:hypothetical protein